jgi:hypothetical protein
VSNVLTGMERVIVLVECSDAFIMLWHVGRLELPLRWRCALRGYLQMGMSMRTAVECGTANHGLDIDYRSIYDATTSDVEKTLIKDECRVRATSFLCVEALRCLVGSDGAYRRVR